MVSNKIQSGIVYWICSPISRYNSVETVGNEEFNPIYILLLIISILGNNYLLSFSPISKVMTWLLTIDITSQLSAGSKRPLHILNKGDVIFQFNTTLGC